TRILCRRCAFTHSFPCTTRSSRGDCRSFPRAFLLTSVLISDCCCCSLVLDGRSSPAHRPLRIRRCLARDLQ
ncbi:hypothetical protein PMAYCL1PPCAC_03169, partial [Pristionchus mayeri]